MSDSQQKLVHMANQIIQNLRQLPPDEAVETLTNHINKFWDPRMRKGILALAKAGGAGFDPMLMQVIPSIHPPKAS